MDENPTVTGEFSGRYTIEHELGRGGAAVVYLARDGRQDRHVALKVLHKELAQAIGAKRFLREIKHSSALQHPHLLPILDSGESRGTLYYVMPYMEDGSLRARIAKEKQLPIDDSIAITRDVGEALAYAHSRGIVHRDIKPDNVLFSGSHACLADFGIARAVDSVAADTLTSTGLVVGTPAYMSPEQASGEKTVDARSDQYSLACLLYEMITGLPPFIGATQQSVISQRFSQPPPSMRVHRPTVPEHLERAVKRAMAVVPADRFPGVTEFIAALTAPGSGATPRSAHATRRRWLTVGAAAAAVTLAALSARPAAEWVRGTWGPPVDTTKFVVLPFHAEEDQAQGERVAAGLYSALSRWEGLPLERDIAVRDALAANGGEVTSLNTAISVARKLGAGRLVWGRVTSRGGGVRVYADVYDVTHSRNLIERSIVADSGRLAEAELQRLANSLLAQGSVQLGEDDGHAGTRSYPAWQAYLRGMTALRRWDLIAAERELLAATGIDPDFAVAQIRLAQVASWVQSEDDRSWTVNAGRAVALREELGARDAKLAEALLALGRRDYGVACERFRELVRTDTLDAAAWYSLGGCLTADNIVIADRASPSGLNFRSSWHLAGQAFIRALEIDPRLYAIPRFDWISRVFPVARNRIRVGYRTVEGSVAFGARPSLIADTLAFTPYPMPDFERDRDQASQLRRSAALARNSDVLLDLATTWTRTIPTSSEAFRALATVRENRGELMGTSIETGALQSLGEAKRLAVTRVDSLAISEAEVRIMLKLEQYGVARDRAVAVLASFVPPSLATWKPITRLAGLTGKLSAFEGGLQYFWAEHVGVPGLDQTVARAGAELLARAALAVCDPDAVRAEKNLRQLVGARVQPERHDEIDERVVSLSLSYLTTCTNGRSMAAATRDASPITRAQIAFARGDRRSAVAALDTLARNRASMRPGDMAINLVVREATLRMHLGDTATASGILDMTLDAAPTLSASIFEHPLEGAMLVRAMVMRADLAAAGGDGATSRKWAGAAAQLWKNADPELQPVVRRMQSIAQRTK